MTDCMKIPKKIGKYDVRGQVGQGSMGIVCAARDPFSNTDVAIKIARANQVAGGTVTEQARKMFFNEARTAGLLDHPNILKVLDAGTDGDLCYIVSELVEGGDTLKRYCVPDALLPYKQAIEIIFKCAKALDYAHRKGVVHRDIKPTNILLTKDKDVKLADFSIARTTFSDSDITLLDGFIGSPRYMSPEQVREGAVTNQTDIFSLGVVMFEMFTGRHPFHADNFSSLIYKIANVPPTRLYRLRRDIPKVLDQITRHALEKTAEKRYRMGLNLAADLSLAFEFLDAPKRDLEEQEKFNHTKDLSFFADFTSAEIWEILRICVWQEFPAGEEIIAEGELNDWFYILCAGDVEVFKDHALVGALGAGDCFGEMGYLSKRSRTATIAAKSDVSLMKINNTLMEQMSPECQLRFSKMFLKTLLLRLSKTTAMYASARKA